MLIVKENKVRLYSFFTFLFTLAYEPLAIGVMFGLNQLFLHYYIITVCVELK